MSESDFEKGAAAERARIREIFENELSAELPADAIRIALESDLDPTVAAMRLRREAAKPDSERMGVEIYDHERVGAVRGSERTSGRALSAAEVASVINAENGAASSPAASSTPTGAMSAVDVMAIVNAERGNG